MKLGIDLIDNNLEIFKGKRVGLITNPTGINSELKSTIDVLKGKVNLVALFSPEHGVRGNIQAGAKVENYIDDATGVIVYSLYGESRRPTKEMLENIDVLCIDIQDAGSRFYTYIYTMAYAMMAAKEYNKEFVVFDRPNPINGKDFEGNILDLKYRSFVGYYPILQRYGLTIAELALLFNEEYKIGCNLKLILMEGWKREMYYDDTNLLWVMPSPNLPTPMAALCYNATCIFEGTNVSEGRGTTAPFQIVGAPYIKPFEFSMKLNECGLEGVYFRPLYFTPTFSKHKDQLCGGVEVHVLDKEKFKPVKTGWTMLHYVRSMYEDAFEVSKPYVEGKPRMLEYNTGTNYIVDRLYTLEEQYQILEKDTLEFNKTREKYLLY
jgi:uncharacterized protein YbbC (DUF1343 family)